MIQEPVDASEPDIRAEPNEPAGSPAVEVVVPRAVDAASEPTAQSELDLGVMSTGSAVVDEALRPLESLGNRSVADHADAYEQVLTDLTDSMNEPAARPMHDHAATPTG